ETDTLFVFAREMNGPPMPVAIVRASKKEFPFTFQLDHSTNPMPSRKLSCAGPVVIVARLSKSSQAMPPSGDLEGSSQTLQAGGDRITVALDHERMDREPAAPAQPVRQAGSTSPATRGIFTLSLHDALPISETDTLFVFAREVNGPPMPVAIVRASKK